MRPVLADLLAAWAEGGHRHAHRQPQVGAEGRARRLEAAVDRLLSGEAADGGGALDEHGEIAATPYPRRVESLSQFGKHRKQLRTANRLRAPPFERLNEAA